jgi:hypothetical protein
LNCASQCHVSDPGGLASGIQIPESERRIQHAAVEAMQIYKELSEIERAFSGLKEESRCAHLSQEVDRTVAHIFVASLAFVFDRGLEKKPKSVGIDIPSKEAWQLLKEVRVVEIDLGWLKP